MSTKASLRSTGADPGPRGAGLRNFLGAGAGAGLGSDVLLAVGVLAIVALMVLPLPLFLLDALVAVNIALGVMLVLMGIYIQSALQFAAFPSVLLIGTLFRLALSVATTRMILLEGEAGAIIDTFGSLVAGGNIVVGLVVFLIITLVQFLVIAKGAERVAEVGARFTLDAMPGKQMSIDSDLRSGLIDKVEARRKRQEVELESKLHGSMDGAMKFVKGDAIAGLVIIAINLLGGLAVGVFQVGLPLGEAASKYSILTIGDGLVAQIPALLGAMSAGLIVTRVSDGSADRHLGESIGRQFLAVPRVLIVAGLMCVVAAFVPGLPSSTFLILGATLSLGGAALVPALRSRFESAARPAFEKVLRQRMEPHTRVAEAGAPHDDRIVPLLLSLPLAWAAEGRDARLRDGIDAVLRGRRLDSGVNFPKVHFLWHSKDARTWSLLAWEVPIAGGELDAVGAESTLGADVETALRQHATLFLGMQETSNLLALASTDMPDMVKEALQAVPMQNVGLVLRRLVEEGVPIRNVRGVLEALVQAGRQEKDVGNLVEYVRMALGRQLCHSIAPERPLRAVGLAPALEDMLLKSVRPVRDVPQLALEPAQRQGLCEALERTIASTSADAVLVSVGLRRHLRAMLASARVLAPVLSFPEIPGDVRVEVVERLDAVRSPSADAPDADAVSAAAESGPAPGARHAA